MLGILWLHGQAGISVVRNIVFQLLSYICKRECDGVHGERSSIAEGSGIPVARHGIYF